MILKFAEQNYNSFFPFKKLMEKILNTGCPVMNSHFLDKLRHCFKRQHIINPDKPRVNYY